MASFTLVVTKTSCLGNFFKARPSSCTAACIRDQIISPVKASSYQHMLLQQAIAKGQPLGTKRLS